MGTLKAKQIKRDWVRLQPPPQKKQKQNSFMREL